jgi:hypothetical protein
MKSAEKDFENEVRRVARELWPRAEFQGAALVEGRERDGIFETEECFHLLEATTSRGKDKAEEDAKKLASLAPKIQKENPSKAVKCWLVTRDEPTEHQREAIKKYKGLINILSFSQFHARLVDVRGYFQARENYPFGSVRDPATGSTNPGADYIPLILSEVGSTKVWSIDEISESVAGIGRFVFLGDYGAGKSMTLRQIYRKLKDNYVCAKSPAFPMYVNLRDHYGQTNPAELLERHARNIGYPNPTHLVRAWRAGFVILLIDGFDEVATVGIQGIWKRLQDSRYRAMEAVRSLVRDQPQQVGLVLAGRAHFFDSEKERHNALGLRENFIELSLNEFTTEQIREFLSKNNLRGVIPSWLPSRPLLIGYLVAKGLIEDVLKDGIRQGANPDPARGWDFLLDSISSRESEIEAGIDGITVRRILERLATKARTSQDGLGPLGHAQIVDAFKEVCGYVPDERAMVLLQRLPGLGIDRSEENTRKFVDENFADACRAGDIVEYIKNPYGPDTPPFADAECSLGALGVEIASLRLEVANCSSGLGNAALKRAEKSGRSPVLLSDLVRAAMQREWPIDNDVYVNGVVVPELCLQNHGVSYHHVNYQDCYFKRLEIEVDVTGSTAPRFARCYFAEVDGRISKADLPSGIFDSECLFDSFPTVAETTDAILSLDLPLGTKVLLSILKKLYQQKGSGRKESALIRGLDHHGRRLVPSILRLLENENLAVQYKRGTLLIWLPVRGAMARVGRIIASPTGHSDPIVDQCAQLT